MTHPHSPGPRPSVPARPDRTLAPASRPWSDVDRGWMFDVVTGLLLTGFCGLMWVSQPGVLLLSFGLTLPWIIRRRYPLASFLIAAAAALALVAFYGQPVLAIVAVPMLTYSYARWSEPTLARAAVLLGLLGSVLGPGRWLLHELSVRTLGVLLMTTLACAGMVSLAYVLGRRRRERDERAAQSVQARIERERLLAAEQEQRARVSAINERNRIARELHDIVAHSLSVIVVQAEGGRALAAKRPEKAPEVLATIADTSREALEEMRQMVGLLRSGGSLGDDAGGPVSHTGDYLPMPGLPDLQDLVDKTGDRFTLTIYGEPPTVSPAVGLTVYRIVQESLTNVLKHAGPAARAAVSVTYAPDGIGIRVIDNGRGPGPHPQTNQEHPAEVAASSGDGRGHGLRGMRERVALHQGSLITKARPEGGFEVLAWLPTGGRRDTRPTTRIADRTAVLPYQPAAGLPHSQRDHSLWDQDRNRPRPMGYRQ